MGKGNIVDGSKVAWRVVDGEAIILNLETDFYYSLNDIGTRVWELLNKGNNINQITEIISKEYKANKEKIKKDLKKLIEKLKKEKLISKKIEA